jgi:uncharacterized protein YdeI (YjbR/CyaY-like superfamily)
MPEKKSAIPKLQTLYVADRKAWRSWLDKNFATAKEIWLIYPKKASGKPRIAYNDAVEEAICFGWIDSTVKTFDAEHSMQRFTPRNPKSTFSQPNKERLHWLSEHNQLHPSVRDKTKDILKEKFVFPADILAVLKKDKTVWNNYRKFSPAYQRIRLAYIADARELPDEFHKRLANFLAKTKQNKQIGFGGIEKYY